MPTRVTFVIPGSYDVRDNSVAINEAAKRLEQIAIDGSISVNNGESAFLPGYDGEDLGTRIHGQTLTGVCKDSNFDKDVVNSIHSYLMSSVKLPDDTKVRTRINDVEDYLVG